jgi:hypothetical protein
LDADTLDRTVSPFIITSPDIPLYSNVLNSFMDHILEGLYIGQKKLTKFPGIVQVDKKYILSYSGTPPSNQRFKLNGKKSGINHRLD